MTTRLKQTLVISGIIVEIYGVAFLCMGQTPSYQYPTGTNIAVSGTLILLDAGGSGAVVVRGVGYIGSGNSHIIESNATSVITTNPAGSANRYTTNAYTYTVNDFPLSSGQSYRSDHNNGFYGGPLWGYVDGGGNGTDYLTRGATAPWQ